MLVKPLGRRVRQAAQNELGQMAWGFVLLILFVFMIFAVSFDAGLWFFDHRTAQNQAEAAALAAVLELPSADDTSARAAAHNYLVRNGVADPMSEGCSGDPVTIEDTTGDGEYDLVRVCLSRESGVIFSAISNITSVQVSASAAALVGRANISQVMPWAIVPPDPTCGFDADRDCVYDADGDPTVATPGDCYGSFSECPWGLNRDNLYRFKEGDGGNTGIITACGKGDVNYRACIEGESASGFFEAGETVSVGLQGGNQGTNTNKSLNERYPEDAANGYICDVPATPLTETGYDPDGHALAYERFGTDPPATYCPERLVMIPILASLPSQGGGSSELEVLGVAVFGIAGWTHSGTKSAFGTTSTACVLGLDPGYECGMVWGYLMEGLQPPDYLLQKITNSDNPFAPLLIALVE